ncbi:MAG TPA: serine hydrolase [Sphingobium sp.]|nr:serine hydrolase [Sphingobium sp.]
MNGKENKVLRRRFARWPAGIALLILAGACTAIPSATPVRVAAAPVAPPRPASPPPPPPAFRPAPPAPASQPSPALVSIIETLGRNFNGSVGIAVERVDAGWTVSHNGNKLFPQQSVSKLWVAMTMFDAIDRGKVTLDQSVMIRPSDLTLFHQPMAALVKGEGYQTTLRDLFNRAMTQSDNTANDSVLRTVGGPNAVRGYLARRFFGPETIRFGPGERLLQSQTAGLSWSQEMSQGRRFYTARANLPRSAREKALDTYLADPIDGAAPLAVVRALAKLQKGDMLSPASTKLLLSTMSEARTGPQRIKAGVPAGWVYMHKTGTGQDLGARSTGYNDVGIMTAPDGTSYAIAVMIGETTVTVPQRWELMQSVARSVAALHRK